MATESAQYIENFRCELKQAIINYEKTRSDLKRAYPEIHKKIVLLLSYICDAEHAVPMLVRQKVAEFDQGLPRPIYRLFRHPLGDLLRSVLKRYPENMLRIHYEQYCHEKNSALVDRYVVKGEYELDSRGLREEVKIQFDNMQKKIDELSEENQRLYREISRLNEEKQELLKTNRGLEAELAETKRIHFEENAVAQSKISELTIELTRISEKNNLQQKLIYELSEENQKMKQIHDDLKAEIITMNEAIESRNERITALTDDKAQLFQKCYALKDECELLKARNIELVATNKIALKDNFDNSQIAAVASERKQKRLAFWHS